MSAIVSWYASIICPLSPLARSLIVALVVVLAIVHVRLMYVAEGWLRSGAAGRRMGVALLVAVHIDAAIVAGYALVHAGAEGMCAVMGAWLPLRIGVMLAGAGVMLLFGWILFLPHAAGRVVAGHGGDE